MNTKALDSSGGGDINDACSNFNYGQVHDYTVNITDSTLKGSDFKVLTLSSNTYKFELTTELERLINFRVYDALGKTIVFNNLSKENGIYKYYLDMSFASSRFIYC